MPWEFRNHVAEQLGGRQDVSSAAALPSLRESSPPSIFFSPGHGLSLGPSVGLSVWGFGASDFRSGVERGLWFVLCLWSPPLCGFMRCKLPSVSLLEDVPAIYKQNVASACSCFLLPDSSGFVVLVVAVPFFKRLLPLSVLADESISAMFIGVKLRIYLFIFVYALFLP